MPCGDTAYCQNLRIIHQPAIGSSALLHWSIAFLAFLGAKTKYPWRSPFEKDCSKYIWGGPKIDVLYSDCCIEPRRGAPPGVDLSTPHYWTIVCITFCLANRSCGRLDSFRSISVDRCENVAFPTVFPLEGGESEPNFIFGDHDPAIRALKRVNLPGDDHQLKAVLIAHGVHLAIFQNNLKFHRTYFPRGKDFLES